MYEIRRKIMGRLNMAYHLEKKTVQQTGKSPQTIWLRYATCGRSKLLERVRLGQECPEHWRVVLESAPLKKAG